MFRFAEARLCRHQQLVRLLGETLAPCGVSCDVCSASDLVREAAASMPAAVATRKSFGARAEPRPAGQRDDALFDRLRALRKKLAGSKRLPAYMVFTDATLLEMAARKPRTEDELRTVSGVGPKKLIEYGEAFLAEIAR